MVCADLRLTSPLDGLANGEVTFYWDPLERATSYRLNLFSEGAFLAGFEADGDQTNLTADVSQGAIGGLYIFQVEFIALDANGNQCSQTWVLLREAPVIKERPAPTPTPDLTDGGGISSSARYAP